MQLMQNLFQKLKNLRRNQKKRINKKYNFFT
jgi:hypothetical protein